MKIQVNLQTVFIATSGFVLTLGSYLLVARTSLHPQFFITACGEILKNVSEHVHFNPDGVVSTLILLVTIVGINLALLQLTRFIIAHRKLHGMRTVSRVPYKLEWVVNKHSVKKNSILVVGDDQLTAYTIGLLKPRIVVSQSLIRKLTREQLEAVILHELCHLQSRHVLWLLLSRLISSLFFFVPLIEHLAQQLKTEFELTADAFVVNKQGTRKHLCDSLALNLQYSGEVIPQFATSPIERRVESLLGNKLSFEQIGLKQLIVSLFSLLLMLGTALIQPSQVAADFAFEVGGVCSVEENCQTTDCTGDQTKDAHYYTSLIPASF